MGTEFILFFVYPWFKFQLIENLLFKLRLFGRYTETLIYYFDLIFNSRITYCPNYYHMVDKLKHVYREFLSNTLQEEKISI